MQKHNRYLIVTIWIATIAFIGAGFVGWGSYQYGSKASSIAKVGDIDITQAKFDMSYRNIYGQYNQQLQGKLDDKKAREMGLPKQALNTLIVQAQLLNLANEFGIIVSDDELAQKIAKIPAFQEKGEFSKTIYTTYLSSQRLKAKTFEEVIRDETTINKLLSLLGSDALEYEKSILHNSMSVADKIAYTILDIKDITIDIVEDDLRKYWEERKSSYMTDTIYNLDILWSDTNSTSVEENEIRDFYAQNSFNYIDSQGKQLLLIEAKDRVVADLKMKKSKKDAQREYIAYKKGKIQKSETLNLAKDDSSIPASIWKEIESRDIGSILKPKVIGSRYATIKLVEIIEPKQKSFDEAKELVTKEYIAEKQMQRLAKLSEETLKNIDSNSTKVSDFITLDRVEPIGTLSPMESREFIQELFVSQEKSGIIQITDKSIVYKILEQKIVSNTQKSDLISSVANQIKKRDFESNLIKNLEKRYKTQIFVEGL